MNKIHTSFLAVFAGLALTACHKSTSDTPAPAVAATGKPVSTPTVTPTVTPSTTPTVTPTTVTPTYEPVRSYGSRTSYDGDTLSTVGHGPGVVGSISWSPGNDCWMITAKNYYSQSYDQQMTAVIYLPGNTPPVASATYIIQSDTSAIPAGKAAITFVRVGRYDCLRQFTTEYDYIASAGRLEVKINTNKILNITFKNVETNLDNISGNITCK